MIQMLAGMTSDSFVLPKHVFCCFFWLSKSLNYFYTFYLSVVNKAQQSVMAHYRICVSVMGSGEDVFEQM